MSLITQKTELEQDIADKDAGVLRAATALHYAATVLTEENTRFWRIPTNRLLAILNEDTSITLATLSANSATAASINDMLDQVGEIELSHRAIVSIGEGITFNGTEFVFVPPAPEP